MQFRETRATPGVNGRRLTVADILTACRQIRSPYSTVLEAILIIRDEVHGAVTVVVEARPGGAGTEPDPADHPHPADRPVSDITSRGMRTVRPDDPLDVVNEKFGDPKVRRLVVIDTGNRMLGSIARAGLVPPLLEEGRDEAVEEEVDRALSLDGKGGAGSW